MSTWCFLYRPKHSRFTRLVAYIQATHIETAEIKFLLKYDHNLDQILSVEKC